MQGSAKALHPGTMKATLDEFAAGIQGVISTRPRGLKRQPGGHGIAAGEHLLEAASQMRPDESLASLRNGRGSL